MTGNYGFAEIIEEESKMPFYLHYETMVNSKKRKLKVRYSLWFCCFVALVLQVRDSGGQRKGGWARNDLEVTGDKCAYHYHFNLK